MVKGWEDLKFWKNGYRDVQDYLRVRAYAGAKILPPVVQRFRALEEVTPDKVRVLLLGQDPYHTSGMAHGLAFSVPANVKNTPPSLRNILKEYSDDLGFAIPRNGNLSSWSEKGVLLLNTVLTVEEGKPLSHRNIGWEQLTYEVLRKLSEEREGIVFILLGKVAQDYAGCVDTSKHFIVDAPHPSPLAKGFLGSRIFTRALEHLGETKDFWRLA